MKKLLVLSAAIISTSAASAQYIAAMAPEMTHGTMVPSTCTLNDIGIDTRSATGTTWFGSGSPDYANYTNVTVTSCPDVITGNPTFYWEYSGGLAGSSSLPTGAEDPDVVMVSNPSSTDIWAIAVYYLPSAGAYAMSVASFSPATGFNPMSTPVWTYSYTGPQPHINIDSDDNGNYGIVLQQGNDIVSFTSTTGPAGPALPSNIRVDSELIEPDLTFGIYGSNHMMNIVALNTSRTRYVNFARDFVGASVTSGYSSLPMSNLYEPRIAAPVLAGINDYTITVGRKYAVGSNIHYDILYDINETGTKVANDGSTGSLPAINVNNENMLPAVTYSYTSFPSSLRICLGWWLEAIGPGVSTPNQPRTFIGVDLDVAGAPVSSMTEYLDLSNANGLNNESTIALSGRYLDWAKSCAYTYESPTMPGFAHQLIWKLAGGTWKPAAVEELEDTTFRIIPNPVSEKATIQLDGTDAFAEYTVYNQLGQSIHSGSIEDGSAEIITTNWDSGVYIVQVKTSSTTSTIQLVKQ